MDIMIYPTTFKGTLDMIGSKSLSHRYLIGAALSNGFSVLNNLMDSEDITATKSILRQMGAIINHNEIRGPANLWPIQPLNAHASGSTLRFLIPLAMRFDQSVMFTGQERLPYRSLKAYQEVFKSKNVTFHPPGHSTWLPLEVKGPLKPGDYLVQGDISSQFVTGLCFALPLLEGDSRVILSEESASFSYIQMTLDVLKEFKIHTEFKDRVIYIEGNQTYHALNKTMEGDYSHSIFFLAGALLGGDITLNHLPKNSFQGDQKVLAYLESMGASFIHNESSVDVKKQPLQPIALNMDDTPDLAPMMMALCAFIDGISVFKGLHRLKHKESDRLSVMLNILKRLNVKTESDDTKTIIYGKNTPFNVQERFDAMEDHRIAMTLAMMAPKAQAPYVVKGFECIKKSYPRFLEDYKKIGGVFDILEDSK